MVRTIDDLEIGEEGIVRKFDLKGATGRRLRELGVGNGSLVKVEKKAPFGYPVQIRIKNFSLLLGEDEVQSIKVE